MIFVPVARTPGASFRHAAALKKDTGEVVWGKGNVHVQLEQPRGLL